MTDEKQSFTSHLEELRRRLIICVAAVVVGFVACYNFSEELYLILSLPLREVLPPNSSLVYTTPTEAFLTYMKTAFIGGIFLAVPVILYQTWKFIAPGLYKNEKVYVIPFVVISSVLFIGGAMFGYFFVFPMAFRFLMGFASDMVQALPSMREYLNFVMKMLFAFGIVFETPVVIFFLAKMGVVDYQKLRAFRKYYVVLAFIVAAILTPPDPISQILMAIPLLLLFEVSIIVTKVFGRKKSVEIEDESEEVMPG